jgi:hypothetical protein
MVHSAHLNDDRLFECYMAAHCGELPDPRAAEHLGECLECGIRYDALVAQMDLVREEADAEIDELFPAGQLQQQQQQILRRLEQVHRSARVISFPSRDLSASSHSTVRVVAPRWLAAAAASGLFIGVAVGGFLSPGRFHRPPVPPMHVALSAASVRAAAPAVRVTSAVADAPDDDTFLMELDLALARPHTRELLPLDAVTPHARDNNELAASPRDIVMDVR